MPILKALLLAAYKASERSKLHFAITGLALLCVSGCSPMLIDQQDHGLSVQKALEEQRLPALPHHAPLTPMRPAASELKPAYDRYLLPQPSTSFTPQLP